MRESSRKEVAQLSVLFFLHGHALGLWSVNISNVLKAHGLEHIVAYVYACNGIAAIVAPLAIGALADQRMSPVRVLRWLGLGASIFLALMFTGIERGWGAGWVLVLAQIHALWSVPSFGITTSLVLSRLHTPQQQFGPVRLWATMGWMAAGWMVSWVLRADSSVVSGYAACVAWIATVLFSFTFPSGMEVLPKRHRNWREILGLDALHLLRHPDHKVVFITAALLNMVLAAFYPFTPLHLEALGIGHSTAVMSVGQITEAICMLWLGLLLGHVRLKWVFLAGIGFGVLRFGLFALNVPPAMYLGIFLHGACYTLFVITAQIYLEQRIPHEMRARAQALLTLMMGGIGNLVGSIGCGLWLKFSKADDNVQWPVFWLGLTIVTFAVFVFFAVAYRGKGRSAG
jgi:MFS family permease